MQIRIENIGHINSLIETKAREDVHLEFKRSEIITDRKVKDLTKEVCAFANSDGGTIVIGLAEGKLGLAESIDSGVDPSMKGREWVEQSVLLNIRPTIYGLEIIEIPHGPNILYVINIPKSEAAPHQSQDKRYYKRYGSASSPMEDFEINDVRSRKYVSRSPLIISIAFHNMLFYLRINGDPVIEINEISIELISNFDELLKERGRDISKINIKALKPNDVAEYMIGSGYELFKAGDPLLKAHYKYVYLGRQFEGDEEFPISDRRNRSSVETSTERSLSIISESLQNLEKHQKEISGLIREFRSAFNASGLKLSAATLRQIRGGTERKFSPFTMNADGFSEILSVSLDTGYQLQSIFGHLGSHNTYKGEMNRLPDELRKALLRHFDFDEAEE